MAVASTFSLEGCDVWIVLDGPNRPDFKELYLIGARIQLASILKDDSSTSRDESTINKRQGKIRSWEKALGNKLPHNFGDVLHEHVSTYKVTSQNNMISGNIEIVTALWQADSHIAMMAYQNKIDAIISSDSDFAVYVGPGTKEGRGDLCL